MRGDWAKAKMVFLTKSTERIINKEPLRAPRPDCGVCATTYARLVINTDKTTLEALVKEVLVAKLGYKEDELEVSNSGGIWYDPDMAMDDNEHLEKPLNDIGIINNSTVVIRGEGEDGERVNLELIISNMDLDQSTAATTESFTLIPNLQTIPKKAPVPTATTTTTDAGSSNGQKLPTRTATKRTAEDAELDAGETEAEQITKRGKVAEENNKTITVVDDDGAIMLD